MFLARQVLEEVDGLDESLHYVLDWEYWLRIGMHYSCDRFVLLDSVLAELRQWEGAKTSRRDPHSAVESRRILGRIYADPNLPADVRQLHRTDYSRTYWRRARFQYIAGQNHLARQSALSAWWIAPRAYRFFQVPRFIIRTMLPLAWVRNTAHETSSSRLDTVEPEYGNFEAERAPTPANRRHGSRLR